jgi:putative ABC transport system permease protein
MQFKDILSLAQNANKSNKLRAMLTMSIIAIGLTALIGIITCIEVLKSSIYSNFASLGSNTFTITNQASFTEKQERKKKRTKRIKNDKITMLEANMFKQSFTYPATVSIYTSVSNMATLKRLKKTSDPNISISAIDENYFNVAGFNLVDGRNFNARDIQSGQNTCVLGNAIATKYFGKQTNAINHTIEIENKDYYIIGVLKTKGSSLIDRTDNMVFVTLANARQNFNSSQKSNNISVQIKDVKYISAAKEEALGMMRAIRKLKPINPSNFSVSSNDEIASTLIKNVKSITMAAFFIGFITLLGAAIALMNIMLVAVSERTREIGIAKSLGATNNTMKIQFLLESVLISIKGGAVGILIGIVIGNLISFALDTPFVIPWLWLFVGITICIIVGLLSGIYPAIKASKLNPIEALRYE